MHVENQNHLVRLESLQIRQSEQPGVSELRAQTCAARSTAKDGFWQVASAAVTPEEESAVSSNRFQTRLTPPSVSSLANREQPGWTY